MPGVSAEGHPPGWPTGDGSAVRIGQGPVGRGRSDVGGFGLADHMDDREPEALDAVDQVELEPPRGTGPERRQHDPVEPFAAREDLPDRGRADAGRPPRPRRRCRVRRASSGSARADARRSRASRRRSRRDRSGGTPGRARGRSSARRRAGSGPCRGGRPRPASGSPRSGSGAWVLPTEGTPGGSLGEGSAVPLTGDQVPSAEGEPELHPVERTREVASRELLHLLHPVAERVTVDVELRRGGLPARVVAKERLERPDQLAPCWAS